MKSPKQALLPALLLAFLSSVPLFAETDEVTFSQPELDQMLAPIALYPDVLLSQVLMAATYPLEVVEAARWSRANPTLDGDDAVLAVEDEDWDISVKALVGFPDLIQLMDENLTWTRRLGEAFLLQQEQVMETTQILRHKALEEGNLDNLEHVVIEHADDEIIIEPAQVEVVYVPYYSTRVVYGDWWWYDYPPFYWDPWPGYYTSVGFHWSTGYRVSTRFYFSFCDWDRHHVVVHKPHRIHDRYDFKGIRSHREHNYDANIWRHNPYHRRNVNYRNADLNNRFHRREIADRTHSKAGPPARSVRTDRINRTDNTHRSDRVSRTDNNTPSERVTRTENNNRSQRVARTDDHTSRPERAVRTEHVERTARPKETSQTNRTNRIASHPFGGERSPSVNTQKRQTTPQRAVTSQRKVTPDRMVRKDRTAVVRRPAPTKAPTSPPPAAPSRSTTRSTKSGSTKDFSSSTQYANKNSSASASRQVRENRVPSNHSRVRPREP